MQWYLKALKNYGNFSGRATRKEYWTFSLSNIVIFWLLLFLSSFSEVLVAIIALLFMLVMIIPSFSVGARRLHDIGKTGWWQLLNFVPFGSVVLLVFFIIESEENENQYGPNPYSDLKEAI
ncbi:DUF805 domain-containing protein [Bacillus wiedmannii]|uniref:DUF805 domain-containing protein n=1 Tax=Bacillus wiedmannii TaxID=1890302 RepID=A0A4U3ASX7_9BACI|nr:DUF805 domain-containing protein [Bacillus wiedmannii]TKH19250.1 DUF805 domain-containing protein [Bacillus wiedmannii]TKI91685.1 DUF805 domain-containing protein [Bacillus wiedmannii]